MPCDQEMNHAYPSNMRSNTGQWSIKGVHSSSTGKGCAKPADQCL